jgi:hypothetical protein
MVEEISRQERRGRKHHQCFHCYQMIPPRELREVFTGKDDGLIYTLHSHLDCRDMSYAIVDLGYGPDYWDGIPPLLDELQDSGEFEAECNRWRGQYPHVICRLEFHQQAQEGRG